MTSYTHAQQACTSPLSTVQTKLGQSTHLQSRYTFVFRITERTSIVMSGLRGKRGDRYIAGLRPKWLSRFECFRRDSCERPISYFESAGVLRAVWVYSLYERRELESNTHTRCCAGCVMLCHARCRTHERTGLFPLSVRSCMAPCQEPGNPENTKNTHTILQNMSIMMISNSFQQDSGPHLAPEKVLMTRELLAAVNPGGAVNYRTLCRCLRP